MRCSLDPKKECSNCMKCCCDQDHFTDELKYCNCGEEQQYSTIYDSNGKRLCESAEY